MPTKDQYEFFKQTLSDEDSRINNLIKRGEIFISIVSFFLTSLFFKLSDLQHYITGKIVETFLFILGTVLLFGTAFFSIISLQVREYPVVNLTSWLNELGDQPPDDNDFYMDRIAEFIAITSHNRTINNKKGKYLRYAGNLLLSAILIIGLLLIIIITYGKK